jgi:hypothetical protein
LTFVTRTDFARFVDLCRSIDGLVKQFPGEGEAALNRGFRLPNRRVNGFVSATEQRRNLVDTQQRICVESESEKHLTTGEVLLVKWRSMGVNWLKFAITASNSVVFFPRHNALVTTARTGCILPEPLESPLDARIERLGVDLPC